MGESADVPTDLCGSCTLCCKVLGVAELDLAPGRWCEHCVPGKGGTIYDSRPPSCRTYTCIWRMWRETGQSVEDGLRPDRCHVILDSSLDGRDVYVRPDPGRPSAYTAPRIVSLIGGILAQTGGVAYLVQGGRLKHLVVF